MGKYLFSFGDNAYANGVICARWASALATERHFAAR